MSEVEPQVPEAEITFRGRKILVRMPKPEQLLVWKRIMARLEAAKIQNWNASQVMEALERTRLIIDTVLVNEADIDWLDDQMLAGGVNLMGASTILLEATKAFGNRAQKRAAAKKTPARRRKAPATSK